MYPTPYWQVAEHIATQACSTSDDDYNSNAGKGVSMVKAALLGPLNAEKWYSNQARRS